MKGGWAKNCTILICKGFLLPWLNGFSIWVPMTESCNIDTLTAAIQLCTLCALTLLTYIYIFRSFRSGILYKHLWSLQVSNTFDDILILTQCCWFYASDWNSYVCKSSIIDIENISQQLTGLHAENFTELCVFNHFETAYLKLWFQQSVFILKFINMFLWSKKTKHNVFLISLEFEVENNVFYYYATLCFASLSSVIGPTQMTLSWFWLLVLSNKRSNYQPSSLEGVLKVL